MNNLEKFAINPTNEFHILRHFKFVKNQYKKTLINQPYWYFDDTQKKFLCSRISKIDIENALKTIGTKFEKNIAGIENPKKLLGIIEQKFQELKLANKIRWIDNADNKTTIFAFDYILPVGQMSCLSIDNISKKDKVRIKRVLRSKCAGENEVIVNTISDTELSFTKTISAEMFKTKQLPFYVVTAYPDCQIDDISDDKLVFVV